MHSCLILLNERVVLHANNRSLLERLNLICCMRSRDKQEQMYQNCLIGREPEKDSLSQTTASELFHDLMGSTLNQVFQQIKDFITKLICLSDTTVLNNILSLRSLALTRTAHAPLPGCTAQFVICKTLAVIECMC